MTEAIQPTLDLDNYQNELVAALVELYPDEDDRNIVEMILIPEFRVLINEVLKSFGKINGHVQLSGKDLRVVCATIDTEVEQKKELLQIEGLFKPIHEKITLIRREVMKHQHRSILAEKGITDRASLFSKGRNWFLKESFPPYGKAKAFAAVILGRSLGQRGELTTAILTEIADKLDFPQLDSVEKIEAYKKIFASKGVTDQASLLAKGVRWFTAEDFPPYGKGKAFAGEILGIKFGNGKPVCIKNLIQIARALGYGDQERAEKIETYKKMLAEKGIVDRTTLLSKTNVWFQGEDFPPYGKGKAFVREILGRSLGEGRGITTAVLTEIANALGFEDNIERYKQILAEKGVVDRETLIAKGVRWFLSEDFGEFGKGMSFSSSVLGKPLGRDGRGTETLEHMADALGFATCDESVKIKKYKEVLAAKGITDRSTLLSKGARWFEKEGFPPYGKGIAFAGRILGIPLGRDQRLTPAVLLQVADALKFFT